MTESIDKLIALAEQQTKVLEQLTQRDKMRTKAPALSPTYTELHGVGSLFGSAVIERDVITAHIRPQGLGSAVPALPSVIEDPRFASITGYTATNGSEAAYPCSEAPAGYVKSCQLTAAFGRIMRDTQTIEIDKVVRRSTRGDFTDLILRGQVLGMPLFQPGGLGSNINDILNVVTKSEMVIAGVNMERKLSELTWQGTPANNNVGGGYREFPGLDSQIATGQLDAESGTACPALDSDIKDFGYSDVCGTAKDIVEYLGMLEYYLRYNATQMGLMPATWAIVMRPNLWFELSACWPCSYLSNRCRGATGAVVAVMNDQTNTAMRDAMRNEAYIDINGNRYPVIVDTGIFESNNINNANLNAGQYASSIYMVPLSITGGFPVTYWEFMDYRMAQPDIALLQGLQQFWTDDGRFLWAFEEENYCYKLKLKVEPRIVLRTPQLAGKIQNVKYEPLQHLREPNPDSPYFYDGGVSMRPDGTKYAVWLGGQGLR